MKLKTIKLTKKDINEGWGAILSKCGLIDGLQALPSQYFMAKSDIKKVRKAYLKYFKKDRCTPKQAKYSEGFAFLNLGPNSALEDVIKPGYVLYIEREQQ